MEGDGEALSPSPQNQPHCSHSALHPGETENHPGSLHHPTDQQIHSTAL